MNPEPTAAADRFDAAIRQHAEAYGAADSYVRHKQVLADLLQTYAEFLPQLPDLTADDYVSRQLEAGQELLERLTQQDGRYRLESGSAEEYQTVCLLIRANAELLFTVARAIGPMLREAMPVPTEEIR